MVDKLRVLSREGAMVPDFDRHMHGRKAFIGWRHDPTLGRKFLDLTVSPPVERQQGGWVQVSEVVEIVREASLDPSDYDRLAPGTVIASNDAWTCYRRAVAEGDLFAADQATLDACKGAALDPTKAGLAQLAPSASGKKSGSAPVKE
jgi:hypothetical protein